MLVRAGSRDDLPAMATVFRRAALTNEGDRDLLSEHPEFTELVPPAEEDLVFVADLDGRVVGFATAKTLGDHAVEVTDLFVDPDHMGSGIARALIDTIVKKATGSGRSVIEVDANRHAVAFYGRLGFLAVREVQLECGSAVRMVMTVPRP
ncbi:MAG: GNAT family N-acetyltransferase [Actinobacteria bacterium]|nr:GNAT family N-acetyltransferase [Actinomycetota bacterium]